MTKTNKHAGFLNESMKSVKSGTTRDLAPTASAPQGARTDARTGITSFIRGSSKRVITSSGLESEGVSLELHNVFPAERNDSIAADHLIALFPGHAWRGEVAVSQGRFVPHSYYAEAIHLFPAGPIPASLWRNAHGRIQRLRGSPMVQSPICHCSIPNLRGS
jgi:hypothetical protein